MTRPLPRTALQEPGPDGAVRAHTCTHTHERAHNSHGLIRTQDSATRETLSPVRRPSTLWCTRTLTPVCRRSPGVCTHTRIHRPTRVAPQDRGDPSWWRPASPAPSSASRCPDSAPPVGAPGQASRTAATPKQAPPRCLRHELPDGGRVLAPRPGTLDKSGGLTRLPPSTVSRLELLLTRRGETPVPCQPGRGRTDQSLSRCGSLTPAWCPGLSPWTEARRQRWG